MDGKKKQQAGGKEQQQTTKQMLSSSSSSNVINSRAFLQIVGSHRIGVPPSLFACFDHHRLVFNASEGFQRASNEHGVKFLKTSHVFLTRISWDTMGGLPGAMLTLRDAGHLTDKFTVAGPPGIAKILRTGGYAGMARQKLNNSTNNSNNTLPPAAEAAGEMVVDGPEVKFNILEIKETDQVVYDEAESMSVRAVLLEPGRGKKRKRRDDDDEESGAAVAASLMNHLAICYICKTPDSRGKFLPQRAAELGVPKGRQFGELCKGNSVTLADGRVIRPEDVVEPNRKGVSFAIVDCPSGSYVDSLANNSVFEQFTSIAENSLDYIIHLTPDHILQDEEYAHWSASFGDSVKHILVTERATCHDDIVYPSSVALVDRLSTCCSSFFSKSDEALTPSNFPQKFADSMRLPDKQLHGAQHLLKFDITYRNSGFDLSDVKKAKDRHELHNVFRSLPTEDISLKEIARQRQAKKEGLAGDVSQLSPNSRLIFLGTGSAVPSKFRNCSGIILEIRNSDESKPDIVLLDPSEGSFSQLLNLVGARKAQEVVDSIKLIWISHIHGDHHFGLTTFLARRSGDLPPVTVIAPKGILIWLNQYRNHCLEKLSFHGIEGKQMITPTRNLDAELKDVYSETGLRSIRNIPVRHCPDAYGLLLEHRDGWKVCFSGDTAPCERLAEVARGSDILIHEATFGDECEDEAKRRRHCTTSQAIAIASSMSAKYAILTHFSQRYPKLSGNLSSQDQNMTVIAAWDLMSVKFAHMPIAHKILSPIEEIVKSAMDLLEPQDGSSLQ
eukprot:TRINITY_DN30907_c0_g1_i1.p1 TRINITY_DN30907_c0_g1~~TRINITY_DN30907_c0_g1_i1.p1  ORF type:complete len:784 (+),score=174.68 TRINITY_DN30907_c0_g1_i1:25-2376(+)